MNILIINILLRRNGYLGFFLGIKVYDFVGIVFEYIGVKFLFLNCLLFCNMINLLVYIN